MRFQSHNRARFFFIRYREGNRFSPYALRFARDIIRLYVEHLWIEASVTPPIPIRGDSTTSYWQVEAGERVCFSIQLDIEQAPTILKSTVGGIPAPWAQTSHTGSTLRVSVTVPRHTPAGAYPISLTLTATDEPRKRTTIPITLEILPAKTVPLAFPPFLMSPRWIVLSLVLLVIGWLSFSYWQGVRATEISPVIASQSALDSVALPPLAYVPVVIEAQWQAGLATPTIAPTPTLRPTPTPLPPLPTPQPPPPPQRAVEGIVDGPYTYQRMFQEVGGQFGVDWRLLASIAQRESQLRPDAVGGSGEQGMMQIMPDTWNEFAPRVGESDPFNPYASARVAAYYLVYLRDYLYSQGYTESYWLLVAYNWGPNNLRRHLAEGGDWGGIPAIRQNYAYTIVNRVNDATDTLWTEGVGHEVP